MPTIAAVRTTLTGLLLAAAGAAAAQTPTTTTLAAAPASSVLGQAVTLTATVTPDTAAGLAVFYDGVQPIGAAALDASGQAAFPLATLGVGTHSLSAAYVGSAGYGLSSSPELPFTVGPRPTKLTFTGPFPNPAGVGVYGVVSATVTDAATTGPAGAPGSFTAISGTLTTPRAGHTATLTLLGTVLIAGGTNASGTVLSATELFDPATGSFTALGPTGSLRTARTGHTATLLPSGKVLIAGGTDSTGTPLASEELYDPTTGQFTTLPGTLRTARSSHTATLLPGGSVLVAGGTSASGALSSMELCEPDGGACTPLPTSLAWFRTMHTATLLADGVHVLVAGGLGTPTAELLTYAAATNSVTTSGYASWGSARYGHTATLLLDGTVLFAGGTQSGYPTPSVAIYRPPALLATLDRFVTPEPTGSMRDPRTGHVATMLPTGLVLVTGGSASRGTMLSSAELHRSAYDPTGTVTVASSDPADKIADGTLFTSGNGTGRCNAGAQPTAVGAAVRTLTVGYSGDANHAPPPSIATRLIVKKGTPAIGWYVPSDLTYGMPLSWAELDAIAYGIAGARLPGTYVYDPPEGTVLGAGTHTLTVTFTPTDRTNWEATPHQTTLSIARARPRVHFPSVMAAITYGEPLTTSQLRASATGVGSVTLPGTFTFTPPAGTVLDTGILRPLRVDFTPADTANYTTGDATSYIDVDKATPTIQWANPAAITYGTALSGDQLNATATGLLGLVPGTFAYAPTAGSLLGAGPGQALVVSFTPSDSRNYNAATATVHLDVQKANPTISWPTPAGITFGTPLSAAQLDASATGVSGATLPGAFSYNPASGTLLNAGSELLEVSFTPDDTINYASPAAGSIHLDVAKATPIVSWANPAPILHGTPLGADQLDASFTWPVNGIAVAVGGTVIYSPPAGTVLDPGPQTLTVQFVPDDAIDYDAPAVASVTIDVLADLTITPGFATVTAGGSQNFTASGGSGAGWTWSFATNASGGRISVDGVYTAGSTAGVLDVVQVEDSLGHTTTAAVTVAAAPPPRPPSGGDGGGGCGTAGAGGEGSALAVGVLLLGLVRRQRRRAWY